MQFFAWRTCVRFPQLFVKHTHTHKHTRIYIHTYMQFFSWEDVCALSSALRQSEKIISSRSSYMRVVHVWDKWSDFVWNKKQRQKALRNAMLGMRVCMYVCMCVCMYESNKEGAANCDAWHAGMHVCMYVCMYVCLLRA